MAVAAIQINGETIPEERIAQELQYHPADSVEEAMNRSAEALVIERLLLQRCQALGIQPETQQKADETYEEACIRELLAAEVKVPNASDEDCRTYFEANRAKFSTSPLLAVSHILIAADPRDFDSRRDARQLAESLIETLQREPALFDSLAISHSACPSKDERGFLGQIEKGQTTPEFENQLLRLGEGLAPSPLESRYGFHVVQVLERVEGQPLPYAGCKEKIRLYLQDQAYIKAVKQYISLLLSEAEIVGIDMEAAQSPLVQ